VKGSLLFILSAIHFFVGVESNLVKGGSSHSGIDQRLAERIAQGGWNGFSSFWYANKRSA